jgi:hypothetical protein
MNEPDLKEFLRLAHDNETFEQYAQRIKGAE